MIQLFNTATQKKEEFKPAEDSLVKIYTCGPTVYNKLHIGNWSAYIYWDVLIRMLLANDMTVDRVLNITDVGHLTSDADEGEDKLEASAKREGKTAWDIAREYTEDFMQGMNYLGMIMPEHLPKATDYIPQQIDLVRKLKEKGFTYQTSDGIYYDTSKFPRYADFARLKLDQQEAGARIGENTEKKNPSDFALWKFSTPEMRREMEWPTPADITDDSKERVGFPGWHLECSAMAMDKLGETIDIHTGGIDHIPVHHTNEIAQSEAATGKPFANYWLHNNFLLVDGTKVSKSLGNTYELKDMTTKGFTPQDFRMFVMQSHYASESNFTWDNLQAAKNRLNGYKAMAQMRYQQQIAADKVNFESAYDAMFAALQDDLNTPVALQILSDVAGRVEENGNAPEDSEAFETFLVKIDALLGTKLSIEQDISESDKKIIASRQIARESKDWAASDRLRDELAKRGISLRDTKNGQIWSRI